MHVYPVSQLLALPGEHNIHFRSTCQKIILLPSFYVDLELFSMVL